MSTVIYAINLSADGCCDHTKFSGADDMVAYFTELMDDIDLLVWGRKTYDLMVPYWPEVAKQQSGTAVENAFATRLAEIDKVVFSRTLEPQSLDNPSNTRIVSGDLHEEFLKLKQESGAKKISIGGVSLPSELIALGLVDEFCFLVHPILVGQGRHLLEDVGMKENLNLTFVKSEKLSSGAVAMHYVKQ